LPAPRPRKALPHRELRVLVVERAGAILFERRPATGVWSGLWSLPELSLDTDLEAGVRARFGSGARVGAALAAIEHGFTHYTLTLHPQRVSLRGRPLIADGDGQLWLTRSDALAAALPAPIKRLVAALGDQAGTVRGGSTRTAKPSRHAKP
jgi:A/G-specific adenine glycosylase